MNITLNTGNLNNTYNTYPQQRYSKNINNSYRNMNYASQQSFSGMWFPSDSQFLSPLKKGAKKLFDGISKHYTKRVVESPVAVWLSKQDKIGKIVNHMQTLGSFIISGMYMFKTYTNQDMDEDRKQTLMVNQAFTLAASTAGAYLIDDRLANIWDRKVAAKYASAFLQDDKFIEKFDKYNEQLKQEFFKKAENAGKKFKPVNVSTYVKKVIKNPALQYKLGGLDILKSLAVFGTVYRFLSPVAVTPFANWASDKFIHGNKVNKNAIDDKAPLMYTQANIAKPNMDDFLKKHVA